MIQHLQVMTTDRGFTIMKIIL